MKRLIWFMIPFVAVLFVCAKAEKTDIPDQDYPQAPDFTLKDLQGNEISLSDLKDKVIFLNFWATWCPPCRVEIPDFVEAYKQYKAKGMVIIGVSVDRTGTKSILKFADKYKINYPIVMSTSKILRDYAPGQYIPVTIIIDRNGKIRYKKPGILDKKTLENWFLKLMEEK